MRHGKLSAAACTAVLCLLAVATTAGWSAAATLTGMAVVTEGEVTRIHVTLDEPVEFSYFALRDPARLFIDCRGVDKVLPESLPGAEGAVSRIEASVWKGDGSHAMTRIAIDLSGPTATEVTKADDGILVTLHPDREGQWQLEEGASEESAPATSAAEAGTDRTAEPATEPNTAPAETAGAGETAEVTEMSGMGTLPADDQTPVPGPSGEEIEDVVSVTNPVAERTEAQNEVREMADAQGKELTPAEEMFLDSMSKEESEAILDYKLPAETGQANFYKRNEPAVRSFEIYQQGGLSSRPGPRVSLDIQGADIYTVLRSISEYSGVNIVMGYDVATDVSEPLSYHLENVPWGEALETVLRSAHLWYREENGIIRVDTEKNLREEEISRGTAARQMEEILPLTTQIVTVIYATAHELAPAVEKTLSKRGEIEVDSRTNSLVVTDISQRVEAAVEMIQHLDSQTPQIEIVAKLVDVDSRYSQELGVQWYGSYSSVDNNVPIYDPPGNVVTGDGGSALMGSNNVIDPAGAVQFGIVRSWGEVQALLSVLERENKANIISNPRITTVNNRQARILVGKKIPLITLDEAGNTVTTLTTIGISLLVTPHINDNNRITLDLHPEVSDLAQQATVQGGIIINTSEADTRVMLDNGQTAVIGGLIRMNDTTTETGVPILMDIPLIGDLFFKGSTKIKEKRELIIFITPRIVNTFSEAMKG